ncbi:MAG: D-amino acid oxidase [Bryobacterales bacterium]|nr:D-amino acid oxidase [Bryobacterales bacterium]
MPTRRELLRSLAACAPSAFTAACVKRRARVATPSAIAARRSFAPVIVSPDRIIRTVVGLRPFRPSGFVVKAETVGEKVVVHNYGHGGGGMTLSWGTGQLALELALPTGADNFAVLGCGGVGLATARLLQKKGKTVTIYARDLPPNTTSNIAGAQVWPATVFDTRTPEFTAQFLRAARFSYNYYQTMVGSYYGVRWVPNYSLSDTPREESFMLGFESPLADTYPEFHDLERSAHPFPVPYVRQYDTMLIEPPVYLNAMLRDFQIAGGRVSVRELPDRAAVQSLPEPVIVNCTGLGAKALFGDEELMPIKGQLTFLLPQPEVDYNVLYDGLYMFPRTDGILLGGTHERGVWSLDPDLAARDRIVAGHRKLFSALVGPAV